MKVRMKVDVTGSYFGMTGDGFYAVRRGDIVDLNPAGALHELRNNRCELTLTGPINDRDRACDTYRKEMAKLEAQVAAEIAAAPADPLWGRPADVGKISKR